MALLHEDWILSDSFIAWAEGRIDEGKSIGTYKVQDLKLHNDAITAAMDPAALNKLRHNGATQGRRALAKIKDRTESALMTAIEAYQTGKIVESEFKQMMQQLMRSGWYDTFKAGVRAGGVPAIAIGKGRTRAKLKEGDDKWFKSAMTHEMRYLNRLVRDIVGNDYKMPLPRRVKMYMDSLDSFFESSRVIALPDTTLIHWTGPADKVTCASCRYLFEQSPFTKHNLPTVPRAGLSLCLTSCRDKLLIRVTTPDAVMEAQEGAPTRDQHVAKLYRIRRGE